jgi:hypothetical protein
MQFSDVRMQFDEYKLVISWLNFSCHHISAERCNQARELTLQDGKTLDTKSVSEKSTVKT